MKKIYPFLIAVFIVLIHFSCEKEYIEPDRTVKYEVKCSPNGFDITYTNSSGNTEQKDISEGSWEISFQGESGDFVYISAQADNENANISVKIYYQGSIIEQASSSGDYVIATASGLLP